MPTTLSESRLEFTFDDDWFVVQWDQHPMYRASGAFCSLPHTKGVDVAGTHPTAGVVLFEMKNFTGHHHDNREKLVDEAWFESLSCKVRDSLANATWARGRTFDEGATGKLLSDVIDAWVTEPVKLRVVLWIEDRPSPSAPVINAMINSVRRHLQRWLKIKKVLVTNTALLGRSVLPGLSVRPVPET